METPIIPDGEYPNRVPQEVVVSVYMITYNHAPYIAQAIDSVLMQKTDFPIELCIGEDRSTDGTREICVDYAKKHPDRIRLFLRSEEEKVKGSTMPPGRWNGYLTRSACRGEFVALLEGDDFWIDIHKLQRQVQYFQAHPEANICATRALHWKTIGNSYSYLTPRQANFIVRQRDLFLGSNQLTTATLMYRSNRFEDPFNWSSHIRAGDWALLVTALNQAEACETLPQVTAVYRVHAGGTWSGAGLTKKDFANMKLASLLAFQECYKPRAKREFHIALSYNQWLIKFHEERNLQSRVFVIICGILQPGAVLFNLGWLICRQMEKMVCYVIYELRTRS